MRLLLCLSVLAGWASAGYYISTSHPLPSSRSSVQQNRPAPGEIECAGDKEALFRRDLLLDVSVAGSQPCARVLFRLFSRRDNASHFSRTLTFSAAEVDRCKKAKLEYIRIDSMTERIYWIFKCTSSLGFTFLAEVWSLDWISWMMMLFVLCVIYMPLLTIVVGFIVDRHVGDMVLEKVNLYTKTLSRALACLPPSAAAQQSNPENADRAVVGLSSAILCQESPRVSPQSNLRGSKRERHVRPTVRSIIYTNPPTNSPLPNAFAREADGESIAAGVPEPKGDAANAGEGTAEGDDGNEKEQTKNAATHGGPTAKK